MEKLNNCFKDIVSEENLWHAWKVYRQGKSRNQAVREFEKRLEDNLICLKKELMNGSYQHGDYFQFTVFDPKRRTISAPTVRDHLVHQAVYNILYPFFEKKFSPFSFSCRLNKGTHRAMELLEKYVRQESDNWRHDAWVLHGDIAKCFDSINHSILIDLLQRQINCPRTIELLEKIIESYNLSTKECGRGIPLGNLTSQIFINIYLHLLDKFVKEELKVKKYLRYADDFLIITDSRFRCFYFLDKTRKFLWDCLRLQCPPNHEVIRPLSLGVEVLGQKFLRGYHKCRRKTYRRSRRIFLKRIVACRLGEISSSQLNSTWQSLKGMLKYGHNFKLIKSLINLC